MRIPCSVILKEVGPHRIEVIHALRDLKPNLSIRERKEFLAQVPCIFAEDVDEPVADRIARDLRYAGASVEVKRPDTSTDINDWLKEKKDLESLKVEDPGGFTERPVWQELSDQMLPGDEIWSFSSPGVFWQNLCGRAGYAVVRDGKVAFAVLTAMN